MLPVKPQTKAERQRLLALVPPDAVKISVQTASGRQEYKAPGDLADTDTILTKKDGAPIVVRNKPGRPSPLVKPNALPPTTPMAAAQMKDRDTVIRTNPLVKIANASPGSKDLYDRALKEMTEEAASLLHERKELERQGEPSSHLSMKRIQALTSVLNMAAKRRELYQEATIDLDSPAFKTLFSFILATFGRALEDADLRPEIISVVFAKLNKILEEGWHDEAKAKMKAG